METNRGELPGSATAEPKVDTPAAPKDAASSLPEQDKIGEQVQKIRSVADLRRFEQEQKTAPKAADTAKPAETKAAELPAKVTEEKPKEAAEETPPTEEAPPAEEAPTEEPETPPETQDSEITPVKSDRPHVRVNKDDEHGRLTLAYQIRNKDWTLKQAMAAADEQLGVKPSKEPAAQTAKSDLPETVSAVDLAADKLMDEKDKAATELRLEDVAKLDRQLRKLDRHRVELVQKDQQQQAEQAREYDTAFTKSEAKAIELYAFAGDPNSAGAKRMVEIEETLKDTGDPLYSSPDKPLRVAQMVAAELRIAPKGKGTAVAAKPTAIPVAPAPKKQVLPGGGSQTQPPAADNGLSEEIKGLKTELDFRNFQKKHGIKI